MPILPEITSTCPPEFTAAVWHEFFRSRNRGVSCAVHLGWLESAGITFVGLRQSGVLVAGLVVRGIAGRAGMGRAGMIGLVWVEPALRGQGLSRILLAETIAWSQKQGLMDLVLWTGKPDVYAKAGFRPCDNAMFGPVRMGRRRRDGGQVTGTMSWPGAFDSRSLPAFACAGTVLQGEGVSAVVLSTAAEPIVAEWTGDDRAVMTMLAAWMPERWSLNALDGDALPELLRERGDDVALAPARLRMILSLDGATADRHHYPLRLLDRI